MFNFLNSFNCFSEFLGTLYQTTTEGDSIGQAFIDHVNKLSPFRIKNSIH